MVYIVNTALARAIDAVADLKREVRVLVIRNKNQAVTIGQQYDEIESLQGEVRKLRERESWPFHSVVHTITVDPEDPNNPYGGAEVEPRGDSPCGGPEDWPA